MMQNQKKETFNTAYLLSPWKNTPVIALIKKPTTFWCLVTPQYAPPLCSTSTQSSSFLKVTHLGVTFSHHLAVNEWVALGIKLEKYSEIARWNNWQELEYCAQFCQQDLHQCSVVNSMEVCTVQTQPSRPSPSVTTTEQLSTLCLWKSTARKGLQSINRAGLSSAVVQQCQVTETHPQSSEQHLQRAAEEVLLKDIWPALVSWSTHKAEQPAESVTGCTLQPPG